MAMKKNRSYWEKRQYRHERARHDRAEHFVKEAQRAYDESISRLEADIARRLVRIADDNGVSVTEAMRRLSKDELKGWKMSLDEYIALAKSTDLSPDMELALKNASSRVHLTQLEEMKNLIKLRTGLHFDKLNQDLGSFLGDEWDDVIKKATVDGIAKISTGYSKEAMEAVLSKPWAADGLTFSKRIWDDRTKLSRRLQDQLEQSIMVGKNPKEIIKDMQGITGKKKSDIARLVYTEHAYVASEADKFTWEEMGLEKYQISAVIDAKTSDICREMDGKIFDMKTRRVGINAPPFHPYCRTVTVPWFDELVDEELEDDQVKEINLDAVQNYKNVIFGPEEARKRGNLEITGRSIRSSKHKVWVSEQVKFSRKNQQLLEKELNSIFEKLPKVEGAIRPDVLVLDPIEMARSTAASYNAVENNLYINAAIFNKETRKQLADLFANGDDLVSTFYHEGLHWVDAWRHIGKGNVITDKNFDAYIAMLDRRAKQKLDKLGITADNVDKISDYADESFEKQKFDEVYTEYRVVEKLRKGR